MGFIRSILLLTFVVAPGLVRLWVESPNDFLLQLGTDLMTSRLRTWMAAEMRQQPYVPQ